MRLGIDGLTQPARGDSLRQQYTPGPTPLSSATSFGCRAPGRSIVRWPAECSPTRPPPRSSVRAQIANDQRRLQEPGIRHLQPVRWRLEAMTITGGSAVRGGGMLIHADQHTGGKCGLRRPPRQPHALRWAAASCLLAAARLPRSVQQRQVRGDASLGVVSVKSAGGANTASVRSGSGLFKRPAAATLIWARPARPISTHPIVVDHFNGTGGIPTNWTQFEDQPGNIVEKPHNLTITDSAGNSAGIVSTAKTVPFNPVGVKTTISARIKSLTWNAAPPSSGPIARTRANSPVGYLAAGHRCRG